MCPMCNSGEENDINLQDRHKKQMKLQYGNDIIDILEQKSRSTEKMTQSDINRIAKHYRKLYENNGH